MAQATQKPTVMPPHIGTTVRPEVCSVADLDVLRSTCDLDADSVLGSMNTADMTSKLAMARGGKRAAGLVAGARRLPSCSSLRSVVTRLPCRAEPLQDGPPSGIASRQSLVRALLVLLESCANLHLSCRDEAFDDVMFAQHAPHNTIID